MIGPTRQALLAEYLGTAALLAVVVGSGIMGERLSAGNAAIALLANAGATGTGLFVLITLLAPLSGAHLNPLVSVVAWMRGHLAASELVAYVVAQIAGAVCGVMIAHAMFDLPLVEFGAKVRSGAGQWFSEFVATAGLLATILLGAQAARRQVPALVGCYIAAAYWFTASTSFANPAVTLARSLTDTFAGIRPADVGGFIAAQTLATALVIAAVRRADARQRSIIGERA